MSSATRLVQANAVTTKEPHFSHQQEMDNLIRDMGLIEVNAELLTSRQKEWHFLDSTCKVSKYRKRHLNIFFTLSQTHSLCYCSDIFGLFALLYMISNTSYNWEQGGDLKMLAFFLGLQGGGRGYAKYSCFLCLWNSRADDQHYSRKQWPLREELTPGSHNVIC